MSLIFLKIKLFFFKKNILIVLGLFLFYGCENSSEKEIFVTSNDFSETVKLENAKKIHFNQLSPSALEVFDSLIIVSSYEENPRLNIYDKKNQKFINGFGFIGKGPNEYSAPEWNGQFFFKENNPDTFIHIYEFGYGVIHEMNLSAIIRKEDYVSEKKYYLPPEVMNADNIFFLNDTLLGEATNNPDVKYFKHKLGNDDFTAIGSFNDSEIIENSNNSIEEKVNLDRSFLSYSPYRNKFVSAYLRFNKIVVMNAEMEEEKVLYYGNDKKSPENKNFTSRKNIFYFRKPIAGKNYIYVPYVGVRNEVTTFPKELLVFDYDGNPIKKYLFEEVFSSFTIDEKEQKLYVITNSEDQYLVYDL